MATETGAVNNYGSIRLRVKGTGNFRMTLYSLDSVKSETLVPLVLSSTPGEEPLKKCNFNQQRAQLQFGTTAIDEYFEINKIVIFIKPIAENLPG